MKKRDELKYLTDDEFDLFSQLGNEQQKTLLSYSQADQKLVLSFPLIKIRALLSLTPDRFSDWKTVNDAIKRLKKRVKDLEQALDDGAISQKELNQAYTNIRENENRIAENEKKEQEILVGEKKGKRIDTIVRPGGVSIRPLPDRDFSTPRKRK